MKIIIAFFLFGLFFVSCNNQNDKQINEIKEPPPSIKQAEQAKHNQIITIDEAKSKVLNIEHHQIKSEIVEFNLTAPGSVEPAPENIGYVASPISGRIVAIYAHEGENVRKGQLLLEIESLEYGSLLADLLQAKSELDYQVSQLDRISKLTEKKISSASELEKSKSEYTKAEANYKAAKSRLLAIGVNQKQIDNIINGNDTDPHLKIYAPISGAIDKHLVDLGKAVNSLENLMTIIDLSRVMVRGYLAPEEADLVSVGNKVCILHRLSDNKICEVPITSINPALDEGNKSVVLNILTKTQNNFPKPGLNVRLEILVRTPRPMIKIPVSAISYEGNEPTVFVRLDNNKYEKRFIEIYKTLEKYAIVNSGLKDGEQIAISQVFSLKALGRFEQFAE